jgi:hypothetical protein
MSEAEPRRALSLRGKNLISYCGLESRTGNRAGSSNFGFQISFGLRPSDFGLLNLAPTRPQLVQHTLVAHIHPAAFDFQSG